MRTFPFPVQTAKNAAGRGILPNSVFPFGIMVLSKGTSSKNIAASSLRFLGLHLLDCE